jgi:hypothetical protein
MQSENNDVGDTDMINIETAMADANRAMCAHDIQARVVDAAMAARAAFHAQVVDNELSPMPPEIAGAIAQMAFAATWNSNLEG